MSVKMCVIIVDIMICVLRNRRVVLKICLGGVRLMVVVILFMVINYYFVGGGVFVAMIAGAIAEEY